MTLLPHQDAKKPLTRSLGVLNPRHSRQEECCMSDTRTHLPSRLISGRHWARRRCRHSSCPLLSLYRTALSRNHKHDNKTTKMRWFSSLTGRKTKAYKKVLKVEEKRHMRARGAPWSHRTRGRGVCTSRLVALTVLVMSIDTLSSVAITFLLPCVFSLCPFPQMSSSEPRRVRALAQLGGAGRSNVPFALRADDS